MSAPPPVEGAKKGKGKKLILLLALLVVVGGGAGAWFSGFLPKLLGKGGAEEAHAEAASPAASHAPAPKHEAKAEGGDKAAAEKGGHGAKAAEGGKAESSFPFMDLPDIVANLNGGPRRTVFVKLKAKLELARPEDGAAVKAAMPRVLDLFQGYLREMRPEEMRGSASTYRLREELLARTNLAVPSARVLSVLFTEVLVQ